MNYGSRLEHIECVKEIAKLREGELQLEEINESLIDSHLMTSHLPEPDY